MKMTHASHEPWVTAALRRAAACMLLVLLGTTSAAPAWANRLLHSQRSLYREVLVYQDGNERCMCFTRGCRVGRLWRITHQAFSH